MDKLIKSGTSLVGQFKDKQEMKNLIYILILNLKIIITMISIIRMNNKIVKGSNKRYLQIN